MGVVCFVVESDVGFLLEKFLNFRAYSEECSEIELLEYGSGI
jgi:hypothetical protein